MVNVELNETFPETSDTNNDHTWTRIRVDTAPRQLRLRLVLEKVSVWLRFPERMPWGGRTRCRVAAAACRDGRSSSVARPAGTDVRYSPSTQWCSFSRCLSSDAFSRFIANVVEVCSFEEIENLREMGRACKSGSRERRHRWLPEKRAKKNSLLVDNRAKKRADRREKVFDRRDDHETVVAFRVRVRGMLALMSS